MKNEHILPNTEVPIELRKEVYKEALGIIENAIEGQHGLCILLPELLWGVDDDYHPNGKIFYYSDSDVLFPELKNFLKKGYDVNYTNQERIEFLKSVI